MLVRSPGRINLLGEHTDYNHGFVLPAAIQKEIRFEFTLRPDCLLRFHALDLGESFEAELPVAEPSEVGWANYLLGVVAALARRGHQLPQGVEVRFAGDIPAGAGLSSSAALESGFAFGLNELFGFGLDRTELALVAQEAEHTFAGVRCGIMDMYASLHGKANHFLRLDCRHLTHSYFPFNFPDYQFILCDSGVKHALAESAYNARRAACEQGVAILQKYNSAITHLRDVPPELLEQHRADFPDKVYANCRYVVEEMARVEQICQALAARDSVGVGQLLTLTHYGLRDLYQVSCPELDFLVDEALLAGSLGSRLMGGGFGGCTLNLVPKAKVMFFKKSLASVYFQRFGLELRCYDVQLTDGVSLLDA